jgi:hypothetical protein
MPEGNSGIAYFVCCPLVDALLYPDIAPARSSLSPAQSTDSKVSIGCRERSPTCLNLPVHFASLGKGGDEPTV